MTFWHASLHQANSTFRCLPPLEVVMKGLISGSTAEVEVRRMPEKGRAVFVTAHIPKGSFLCEYTATKVYPMADRAKNEQNYTLNGEECMILDIQTPCGWYCIDATQDYDGVGRLMNHALPSQATAKPFRPLRVHNQWRVGFLSTRDISPGEEITWDYACPPLGNKFLMRRRQVAEEVSCTSPYHSYFLTITPLHTMDYLLLSQ